MAESNELEQEQLFIKSDIRAIESDFLRQKEKLLRESLISTLSQLTDNEIDIENPPYEHNDIMEKYDTDNILRSKAKEIRAQLREVRVQKLASKIKDQNTNISLGDSGESFLEK